MRHLDLPQEITLSTLRGEDPAGVAERLSEILGVAQARVRAGWTGPDTTVVIVPSSESVDHKSCNYLEVLARLSRAAGIRLRLFDVLPPLRTDGDAPFYSVASCGSVAVQQFVNDPAITHITYHQLSPAEMMRMAETTPGSTP